MAMKFGTTLSVLGAAALLSFTACSEGSDDPAGDGDGDATGGTAGDGDGDGDAAGGTTGDGDGSGGTTGGNSMTVEFTSGLDGLSIDWEEPESWSGNNGMGGAGSLSALEHNTDDGDPGGAAQLTAPFDFTGTGSNDGLQKVHLALQLEGETDLSASTVSASIKLLSGGTEDCPVNGKVFVKTGGTYIWGDGGAINLVEGMWAEATMDVANPSYTDPDFDGAAAVQIGIEISPSNGEGCVTGEVVLLIDNISY